MQDGSEVGGIWGRGGDRRVLLTHPVGCSAIKRNVPEAGLVGGGWMAEQQDN